MEFKQYLNQITTLARENICDEVGSLLGVELKLGKPELRLISRGEFRSEILKNYGFATLDIQGPQNGTAYMACSVRDAIFLGGTLVMIPDAELKKNIQQGYFGPDEMDAYGEIANITAGILTNLFSRFHPDKPRFTKSDIEIVEPESSGSEESEPVVHVRFSQTLNGQELDPLDFLFPAHPLKLLKAQEQDAWPRSSSTQDSALSESHPDSAPDRSEDSTPETSRDPGAADLLILYESRTGAAPFEQVLEANAISRTSHSFQDNFRKHIRTDALKGVLVIMDEVSERGLATVIKARASIPDQTPILAAGPQWTRRTVLQAAKYGVGDILVTPATEAQMLSRILRLNAEQAKR